MTTPTDSPPEDVMDAARLIVRTGRWWLDLTEPDVEREAQATIDNGDYREGLLEDGLRYAGELSNTQLRWDLLNAAYHIGVHLGLCRPL